MAPLAPSKLLLVTCPIALHPASKHAEKMPFRAQEAWRGDEDREAVKDARQQEQVA
jgi:hypothetical protein